MAPEASFVLKRGEGLHDSNMIKHKVLHVETGRLGSSVESSPKFIAPNGRTKPVKTSYVSPMQRARQEKKRQELELSGGHSKDWDESTSSTTKSSPSSNISSTPSSKPARVSPFSGNLIPSSGYIAKPRESSVSEGLSGGTLPKFGAWDNQDDAESGPCYTLLFENVAQEKRIGGPFRVHANRPASPGRTEDLYSYNPAAIKARKNRLQLHHALLCCFLGS